MAGSMSLPARERIEEETQEVSSKVRAGRDVTRTMFGKT